MPDLPRHLPTQLEFWIALDRGGRVHFHEGGLQRAKAERLDAEMRAERAHLPNSGNPAYSRLVDNLDERMNAAISAASGTVDGEPPLTPFSSREEVELLLRKARGRG